MGANIERQIGWTHVAANAASYLLVFEGSPSARISAMHTGGDGGGRTRNDGAGKGGGGAARVGGAGDNGAVGGRGADICGNGAGGGSGGPTVSVTIDNEEALRPSELASVAGDRAED